MQGVDVDMDINIFRGIILIVLMFSFIGLWAWAWSRKRKTAFHDASMLPLEEDLGIVPDDGHPNSEGPSDGRGEHHVN